MSAPPESAAAEQRAAQYTDIREAVRRFAKEQLAPNAARWDREKQFPRDALKGLAAMGLYGVAECHGRKGNLFSHHTLTYVRSG